MCSNAPAVMVQMLLAKGDHVGVTLAIVAGWLGIGH